MTRKKCIPIERLYKPSTSHPKVDRLPLDSCRLSINEKTVLYYTVVLCYKSKAYFLTALKFKIVTMLNGIIEDVNIMSPDNIRTNHYANMPM